MFRVLCASVHELQILTWPCIVAGVTLFRDSRVAQDLEDATGNIIGVWQGQDTVQKWLSVLDYGAGFRFVKSVA